MKKKEVRRYNSISEIHHALGLPKPFHPLISLINNTGNQISNIVVPDYAIHDFYKIKFITKLNGKIKYGQGYYDFDEGSMLFTAPNQIVGGSSDPTDHSLYALLIHADFIQGYPIAAKIHQYGYFSYLVNEALHLSDKERATILSIFKIIEEELSNRIDDFSQEVLVAQIELLLSYANRFYRRQFITRKPINNELLQNLEMLLNKYVDEDEILKEGLPSVKHLSAQLNVSPRYLSDMLRSLLGKNTQQLIHDKLIQKAKEKLLTTNFSINELAYQLGFEHPQSFTRLFKLKTNLTPAEFRRGIN